MIPMTNLRILCSVTLMLLLARQTKSLFFNRTSYIKTKPLDLTKKFTLSFRTCNGGEILHQTGKNNDYFALLVVPGDVNYSMNTASFTESSLNLRWQTEGSNLSILKFGSKLDQNIPYSVEFLPRTGNQNATLSISLGSVIDSVQVPDTIYNVGNSSLTLGQGFVGCIDFEDMFDWLANASTVGTSKNCSLNGGKRCPRHKCRPGYKGYYCETEINECLSSPCHHASTCIDKVANYTCDCGPAWYGRNCDILRSKTLCYDNPCLHGGICRLVSNHNNYTCACQPPYAGRNCSETVDPCGSMPCEHNGTCRNISYTDFSCQCPKGYAGKQCKINIDDCGSVDCGHGTCNDGIATFTCNCSGTGFEGDNCTQDINECRSNNPCMNGTCHNYAGGYLCRCNEDFEGKNCENKIDDCLSAPCKNGGSCKDLTNKFFCVCPPGFSGNMCEIKLHSCIVNNCTACDVTPCNHGKCDCTCTAKEEYYNCTCDDGYTGVNCSEDIDECMNNSKRCGDNGTCENTNGNFRCVCSEGFIGRFCNITEGPCNPSPCINGKCFRVNVTVNTSSDVNSSSIKETYNCSCNDGWSGTNCTEDIDECNEEIDPCNKSTSSCVNTIGSYFCQCKSGFQRGENRRVCKDIDECTSDPCLNDGSCRNHAGTYDCLCPNGFSGKNCQNNLNDCIYLNGSQKCIHGVCKDGIATFKCTCDFGWKSTLCDHDIDECGLKYCRNNATCNNTQGSYVCTCPEGYTGKNCSADIDDCVNVTCSHNETCVDKFNDYQCNCSAAYEGKSCEIDIDWCSAKRNNGYVPCDYGTCQDGEFNYTCLCFDGFAGQNCSIDKDECTTTPCKNGAICVQKSNNTAVKTYFGADRIYAKNESAGYLCVCQPGYNGSNCENDINECNLYKPCFPNGTKSCSDNINNYTCNCMDGYTGRNCSEDIDECSSSPCQNNGTCQNLIAQYKCICDSNHTGVNCENMIDPCTALSPCKNDGVCHVISDFNYTCACAEGFAGKLCTDTTTLGFDGTSSMTLSISEATANISFSFRTIFLDGTLVSQSSSWTLSLVSGKLILMCGASSTCEVRESGVLTDSNWHRVQVLMNESHVTAKVDSSQSCVEQCASSRTRRAVDSGPKLVVGANVVDSNQPKYYVGSIRDFSVNDVKYYPGVADVVPEGLVPDFQRRNVCSPDPCLNGTCRDLWTRYSCECDRFWTSTNCSERVPWGTFGAINVLRNGYRPTSNKSYVSFTLSATVFNNLALTVRTRSTSSLIIQLNLNNARFLSVETDNQGFLRLRGSSGFLSLSSNLRIGDGVPHNIYLNSTVVVLDNMTHDIMMKSFSVGNVFVGGLPETGNEDAQFRGCIRDVRLNGQQLLFFNKTEGDTFNYTRDRRVNVVEGCSSEDVCSNVSGSFPCSKHGNCSDLWNDFQCTCEYPYGGNNCELYGCEWAELCPRNSTCVNLKNSAEYECISKVTFNQSQTSAYFTNSTQLSDINSLVVQFRTRQNETIVFSAVYNASYFEIGVEDGLVKIAYNLSENMTGIVNTGIFVSNGKWHELRIETIVFETHFRIFTLDEDKFTYLKNDSISRNISLLSQSFANLLSTGGVHIGSSPRNTTSGHFLGCLREVKIGKHLLSFLENTTVDSNPEFRPARSSFMNAHLTNVLPGCHSNDICMPSLCGNGTCVEGWNNFHCVCLGGYYGDRCQFNPCTSSPCVNGTCKVRDSGFACSCTGDYVGDYCNETCTQELCKNGGECSVSSGKITCTCESDWTGKLCEVAIPRDDDDEDDNLPLIIGLVVAGGVLLLLVIAVLFVCTRQTSSTFGMYSPSGEEKVGARVEMSPVLNVPPPEKLI